MSHKRRLGRLRRHVRVRKQVSGSPARPRLAIYRSLRHIYAQVIDDTAGHTVTAASSLDAGVLAHASGQNKRDQAAAVGRTVAERAVAAGIGQVVFDRGGYRYHGRVKALAEAARAAGLEF